MTDKNQKNQKVVVIDAKGKTLGRLASEIALVLQGKNRVDFSYHNPPIPDKLEIKNIKDIKITGRKFQDKKYYSHSGYLGSLKEKNLEDVFKKDPGEVLRRAVYGMLPKNKLRDKMIKKLKII